MRELLALHEDGPDRWVAVAGGRGVGAATAWRGADRRLRLLLTCRDPAAYVPLARVAATLDGPVYASVDGSDVMARSALTAAGFVLEYTDDVYEARFDAVARRLSPEAPAGFSFTTADRADPSRWFTLDNTLRQDVRGSEGWRGDLRQFAEENRDSPYFDPSAYVIAVDDANGEYAGLVRFWNGPRPKPRLGLLGVVRQYRHAGLGRALLARGAAAASQWGGDSFTGETYRGATAMCALWKRLGAVVIDSEQTLVRRG
ncbi:MAG: GNAT family N-acetyltransferase [Stackebrandtia sp.]